MIAVFVFSEYTYMYKVRLSDEAGKGQSGYHGHRRYRENFRMSCEYFIVHISL